jgi:hypothetical protein
VNRSIRRLLGLFAAVMLGFSGIAVVSAPAYAARSVRFEIWNVRGYITFTGAASYSISATVDNPYSAGWVSIWTQGQYFLQNERRICGGTPKRTNNIYGTTQTFNNSTSCGPFNIQQVMLVEEHTGETSEIIYVDNPLA